jgi:diguanylate cyclase (GGDEF)-like protein
MTASLATLAALARELHGRHRLETILDRVVETAARVTRTDHATLHLLDPTGAHLLAVARAGEPLHLDATYEWRRDEGFVGWIVSHREPIRSGAPAEDPRFLRRDDLRTPMGSFLGVPIVAGAIGLGVLAAVGRQPDHFDAEDEARLVLLAAIAAPHIEVSRLQRLARLDPMTGARNRFGLDEDDGRRDPLSVLFVDIDHLRRVNDEHGHAAGDEVLRTVARVLTGLIRREDAVVRWGGEELVLLLPGVDGSAALRIADRARRAIAGTDVPLAGTSVAVTVSIGVAERRGDEELAGAIERADGAMQAAKAQGRDQVALAP